MCYNKYEVNYYNESVKKTIFRLPKSLLARYIRVIELLEEFGPELGMPHSRAMGRGMFELRLIAKEGHARVLYCMVKARQIIMLSCFIKKQQKTPQHELLLAKQRMKEAKENA